MSDVARMKSIQILHNNPFLKGVTVLASGAVFAQIIFVLFSPVLTRIFTPSEFGLLALFMAMVNGLSPAVCGKYEIAMVLPTQQKQALHLFGIAIYFSTFAALFILIFLLFGNEWVIHLLKAEKLSLYIYLVPFVIFIIGIVQANNYFANRMEEYSKLANAKLIEATSTVLFSIILGLMGYGLGGLIFAYLISLLLVSIYLFHGTFHDFITTFTKDFSDKYALAKKYRDYPLYNASSALLNGITLVLPVFLLNHFVTVEMVGYFMLIQRIIAKPLTVLATSVSMVNLKKVVEITQNGQSIVPYLNKTLSILLGIALIPVLLVFLGGKAIPWVFGPQWNGAVSVAMILCIPFSLRFVVTSLSSTYGATNNSRIVFLKRIISFVILLSVFLLSAFLIADQGPQELTVIWILAIALIIDDLISLILIYTSATDPKYR